jgi:hypothetical protein
LAFADALKNACAEIFGFDFEQLHGSKKEIIDDFWKVSPRTVLQYVGTDLFRNQLHLIIPNIDNNIWIKVIEKKIHNILTSCPNAKIVITDVRFANEEKLIHDMGVL